MAAAPTRRASSNGVLPHLEVVRVVRWEHFAGPACPLEVFYQLRASQLGSQVVASHLSNTAGSAPPLTRASTAGKWPSAAHGRGSKSVGRPRATRCSISAQVSRLTNQQLCPSCKHVALPRTHLPQCAAPACHRSRLQSMTARFDRPRSSFNRAFKHSSFQAFKHSTAPPATELLCYRLPNGSTAAQQRQVISAHNDKPPAHLLSALNHPPASGCAPARNSLRSSDISPLNTQVHSSAASSTPSFPRLQGEAIVADSRCRDAMVAVFEHLAGARWQPCRL